MTDSIKSPAAPPDLAQVECGYCSTTVAVNASSGEVREHKRPLAGRRVRCDGSKQRAFIYPGNLLPGDEVQIVVGAADRFVVFGGKQVAADINVWTFTAYSAPVQPNGRPYSRSLAGDVLLRLWIRQAGER